MVYIYNTSSGMYFSLVIPAPGLDPWFETILGRKSEGDSTE